MPHSFPVTATHSFEIEIALSGTFQPGYPATGPSYASGGDPAEPDQIEDVEVTDIGILERAPAERSGYLARSILTGVDTKSEVYRKIVDNILAIVGEEAVEAMLAEGAE